MSLEISPTVQKISPEALKRRNTNDDVLYISNKTKDNFVKNHKKLVRSSRRKSYDCDHKVENGQEEIILKIKGSDLVIHGIHKDLNDKHEGKIHEHTRHHQNSRPHYMTPISDNSIHRHERLYHQKPIRKQKSEENEEIHGLFSKFNITNDQTPHDHSKTIEDEKQDLEDQNPNRKTFRRRHSFDTKLLSDAGLPEEKSLDNNKSNSPKMPLKIYEKHHYMKKIPSIEEHQHELLHHNYKLLEWNLDDLREKSLMSSIDRESHKPHYMRKIYDHQHNHLYGNTDENHKYGYIFEQKVLRP